MKTQTKRPRGRKSDPAPTTFTYEVRMTVPGCSMPELREALNMAHIGHKDCNVRNKDGILVTRPGVTEAQERKLEDAHWAIHRSHSITLVATRDLFTGEISDIRVKSKGGTP